MIEMTLRAPRPEDASAVLAALHARDVADLGAPDFTLEDLRAEWGASDFDLAADARVAELRDGRIAGYAILRRVGVMAAVAPDHVGQGIGTRLLAWAEDRERALSRPLHVRWVPGSDRRGQELLRGAGFECARSYWRMSRELGEPGPAAAPPQGIDLRPVDRDRDAAAIHALDDECFRPAADYTPHTFEQFCQEHLYSHDVDPALSLVAQRGPQLAGYLITRRWDAEGMGYVDVLGVHPDERSRGLAGALLAAAFGVYTAAGLRRAEVRVASDNPRALQFYERTGMRARFRIGVFERSCSGL